MQWGNGEIRSYSGHAMQNTRPSNQQANARFAGDVAISGSSIAASLLIAEAYESYPKIDGFFRNINDGNAHETKDYSYAQVVEGACNDLCTRHWSHHVKESWA
jgi:hypothetical protein